MPEILMKNESIDLVKVVCQYCGKTLMYFKPANKNKSDCITVEIKCKNRECRCINQIKLCNRICVNN